MTTLYEHRIFCITENTWVYLWKADQILLTTCPNNALHIVQAGSASIIDQQGPNIVQVDKEPGFQTGGHGRSDSISVTAAAGSSAQVTKVWPIPIALYSFRLGIGNDCVGCNVTLEAAPRTTVGGLTANANPGDTVLSVTASAASLIQKGFVITLASGPHVEELGIATVIDTVNNLITVTVPVTTLFVAGLTQVQMTARAADHLPMPIPGFVTFGGEYATAINWPAGQSLVLTLTNPNALPATLTVYITYKY
jgi:hypothetical protein